MNAHPPAQAAPRGQQRSQTLILLLLILILPLALLLYPPARDQSAFLLCGRIVKDGGMPYRDCWDIKGPAVYLFSALAQGLFPTGVYPLRALDVLATWITTLFLLLLLPLPRRQRLLAGVLWELLYLNLNYWNNTQAESFALPFLLAGTWLLVRDRAATRSSPWPVLAAGVLSGIAFLFKYTALFVILPVILVLLVQTSPRRWASFILGAALPVGSVAFWLGWGHALGPLWDIIRFSEGPYLQATGAAHMKTRIMALLFANRWLLRNDHLLPTLLALVAVPVAWQTRSGKALVAFLVGAWLSVHAQGHYWAYHWTWLLPPLAGLALWGWQAWVKQGMGKWARGVLLAGLVGVPLLFYPQELPGTLRLTLARAPVEQRMALFGRYESGHFSLLADWQVAQFVRAHSAAGEPILVWGFEPGIYLMADRMPATRFIYDLPLTLDHPAHRWRAAWRQEFMADLERTPPGWIIVATRDITAVEREDSITQMQEFPEFARWVQAHYTEATHIERFVVYKRAG